MMTGPSNLAPAAAGSSSVQPSITVPLHPERINYPKIKYWTKHEYSAAHKAKDIKSNVVDFMGVERGKKGRSRLAATNENVSMDYVEKADGTVVSGDTAVMIHSYGRAIFNHIEGSPHMTLPPVWGDVGVEERSTLLSKSHCNTHTSAYAKTIGRLPTWHPACSATTMIKTRRRVSTQR